MSTIYLTSGDLGEKFWTTPSIPFQPAWQPTTDCDSDLRVKHTDDICHLGWSQQCGTLFEGLLPLNLVICLEYCFVVVAWIRSDRHVESSRAFFTFTPPLSYVVVALIQRKLVGLLPIISPLEKCTLQPWTSDDGRQSRYWCVMSIAGGGLYLFPLCHWRSVRFLIPINAISRLTVGMKRGKWVGIRGHVVLPICSLVI